MAPGASERTASEGGPYKRNERREWRAMVRSIVNAVILFALIALTAYLAFHYAPIEKSMGVIQKIFYLHIACAFSAFVAFGICFYANLRYVFTRQPKTDWLGVSAAEVGLAFISVVLISGPI